VPAGFEAIPGMSLIKKLVSINLADVQALDWKELKWGSDGTVCGAL